MDPFREALRQHSDWIVNYLKNVRQYPVTAALQPGELIASLPKTAPETGESFETIFSDFQSTVFPALSLWNHPRFFAYFSVSSSPPSILADLLAAAVNVNAMLWKSSPAATELDKVPLPC